MQYAVESRNSRALTQEAFDQAGCTNCTTIVTSIDELERTGFWQLSDPLEKVRLRAVAMQGGVRVQGSFVQPETQNVRSDGTVGLKAPAAPYSYYVDLSWDEKKGTWRVLDFVYQRRA